MAFAAKRVESPVLASVTAVPKKTAGTARLTPLAARFGQFANSVGNEYKNRY
jgi:hypothetical protein